MVRSNASLVIYVNTETTLSMDRMTETQRQRLKTLLLTSHNFIDVQLIDKILIYHKSVSKCVPTVRK